METSICLLLCVDTNVVYSKENNNLKTHQENPQNTVQDYRNYPIAVYYFGAYSFHPICSNKTW